MDTQVTVTEQDLSEVLANSVMLVSFTTRKWSAEATDSDATGIVKKETGAKGNVGKFRKNLLANNDAAHTSLCKAIDAAYRTHIELTRPWGITGYRMLPNAGFEAYLVAMREHQVKIEKHREAFIADFPGAAAKARADLGDLAASVRYPDAAEVGAKFGISFDFSPVNGRTFPGLPPHFAQALQVQLEKQVAARMQGVVDEQWVKIRDTLDRYHRQTRPDGKIFDASVDDVLALPKSIRAFNITGDAKLEAIASIIEKELCIYDRKSLTKDNIRAWVHAASAKVLGMLP